MGQVGLVNLITPLNRATPVTSVVTDDLGVLRPGEDCGCGINSPYLTILGRVACRKFRPVPPVRRNCWAEGRDSRDLCRRTLLPQEELPALLDGN